jgi:hypothetical protein
MNGLLKYHGADFVLLLLGLLGQNKAVAVSKTGSGGGGGGGGTVAGSERKRSRNHLTGGDSGGGGHGSGSGSGHKKKRTKSASMTHNHSHGYGHSLGQSYKSQSLEEYDDGDDDNDDDNPNDAGGATEGNFEDAGRHTENGMSAHKSLHRQQQQRGVQAATPLSILNKKTNAVKLRGLGPSSEERKGDSAEKETIGFEVGTSCWAAVAKRYDETVSNGGSVSTAQTNSSPFRQKEYGIKKCICLTDYGDQIDKRLVSALVSAWMAAIRALDSLSVLQRCTAEGRSLQLVHKLSVLVSGILEYFSPTDCDVVLGDVADVFNEYIGRCNTSAWHSALGLKDSLFSFLEDGGR